MLVITDAESDPFARMVDGNRKVSDREVQALILNLFIDECLISDCVTMRVIF